MKRIFGINRGSIYASLCGYNILAAAVYYFIIIIIYPPFNFLNSNIKKNSKIPACHSSVNSIKVPNKRSYRIVLFCLSIPLNVLLLLFVSFECQKQRAQPRRIARRVPADISNIKEYPL